MSFVRKVYSSDTHFGHANIMGYRDRPFRHVEEMDEGIIHRWNTVVGETHIVYHLGDFASELSQEDRVRRIFERLNGREYLVAGDHDLDCKGPIHPTIAGLGWATAPTHTLDVRDEGHRVYLAHYAHRVWPGKAYAGYHFFGHCHGNLPGIGRSLDIGMDTPDVDFTPKTFAQLTASSSGQRQAARWRECSRPTAT